MSDKEAIDFVIDQLNDLIENGANESFRDKAEQAMSHLKNIEGRLFLLESLCEEIKRDLRCRASRDSDGVMVVDISSTIWHELCANTN